MEEELDLFESERSEEGPLRLEGIARLTKIGLTTHEDLLEANLIVEHVENMSQNDRDIYNELVNKRVNEMMTYGEQALVDCPISYIVNPYWKKHFEILNIVNSIGGKQVLWYYECFDDAKVLKPLEPNEEVNNPRLEEISIYGLRLRKQAMRKAEEKILFRPIT